MTKYVSLNDLELHKVRTLSDANIMNVHCSRRKLEKILRNIELNKIFQSFEKFLKSEKNFFSMIFRETFLVFNSYTAYLLFYC